MKSLGSRGGGGECVPKSLLNEVRQCHPSPSTKVHPCRMQHMQCLSMQNPLKGLDALEGVCGLLIGVATKERHAICSVIFYGYELLLLLPRGDSINNGNSNRTVENKNMIVFCLFITSNLFCTARWRLFLCSRWTWSSQGPSPPILIPVACRKLNIDHSI